MNTSGDIARQAIQHADEDPEVILRAAAWMLRSVGYTTTNSAQGDRLCSIARTLDTEAEMVR